MAPRATLNGFTSDGAVIYGTRLVAVAAIAHVIARISVEKGDVPEDVRPYFTHRLAKIYVTATLKTGDKERIITSWRETVINSKQHEKLSPIMQVKSIVALGGKVCGLG